MCLGWAARDRQQLEQKAPLVYIVKIYCVVRFNNGYRADRQLSGGMCTEGEDERERERESARCIQVTARSQGLRCHTSSSSLSLRSIFPAVIAT